jgi:hypothetical protein
VFQVICILNRSLFRYLCLFIYDDDCEGAFLSERLLKRGDHVTAGLFVVRLGFRFEAQFEESYWACKIKDLLVCLLFNKKESQIRKNSFLIILTRFLF